MKIKKNFIRGRLNKDVDERLLPNGEYRDAQNIVVRETEGSDETAVQNSKGNEQVTDITFDTNPVTLFELADNVNNTIIWFVHDDSSDEIFLYDDNLKLTYSLLRDSRTGNSKVLNFDVNNPITARTVYDSDNDKTFLVWVEAGNEPRMVNIDRVKNWAPNSFEANDITLLRPAPLEPPTLELFNTTSNAESILEERMVQFCVQYLYEDGQYSALSPFSEIAFEPSEFSYDYSTTTNRSMFNKYNAVKVSFNTGPDNVEGMRIIFKEPGSSSIFLIEEINKESESLGDNANYEITFSTDKYYTATALRTSELDRIFDDVPTTAQSLEVVANRIILGNCTQGYDMLDIDGEVVRPKFNVTVDSTVITDNEPVKSLKSNRTVEAGIVYLDSLGRKSPVFTSDENTEFIPNSKANHQNKIQVFINSRAPSWATHYQFFLKDSRDSYEVITPLVFYQDGRYVWIKLEGNDADKVSKGESIYVKSSSQGLLDDVVRVEVLEVKTQERNFLSDSDETTIEQLEGVYMKVKPEGFTLNEGDISVFNHVAKGFQSANTRNYVINSAAYYDTIYKGIDGVDDIVTTGTYANAEDIRYIIEIDATGATDTFQWSDDNGATFTTGVNCAITPTALSNGISVEFGAITGHQLTDAWVISAKSQTKITTNNNLRRAWIPIKGKVQGDEGIKANAVITIEYTEKRDDFQLYSFSQSFTSSDNYANIEEWFFEDQIYDQMDYPFEPILTGGTFEEVSFRRGTGIKNPNETLDVNATTGDMYMMLMSVNKWQRREQLQVDLTMEITELSTDLVFETIPGYKDTGIFYEWGQVFEIDVEGYHQTNPTGFIGGYNQTADGAGLIQLDVFDCFAWNNGYESYKIKDKLTGRALGIDTRPWATYPNFRLNRRVSSLIFSGRYEQTTNLNRLNEFNTSLGNSKDLDDKYGQISALMARDTDLLVWQENKVHRVLIDKSILYNADGTGNVSQNNAVLGQEVALVGEYGLRLKDHRALGSFGNWIWWPDSRRGVVCRIGGDGINEISKHGMKSWFRNLFTDSAAGEKLATYDPYHDQYILTLKEDTTTFDSEYGCGSIIFKKGVTENFSYKFIIDPTTIESWDIDYEIGTGSAIIQLRDSNGLGIAGGTSTELTGSGTFSVTNPDLDETYATVEIQPQTTPLDIKLTNNCSVGDNIKIKFFIVYGEEDNSSYASDDFYWKDGAQVELPEYFLRSARPSEDGVIYTRTYQGLKSSAYYPADTEGVYINQEVDGPPGAVLLENGQAWHVLVSSTEYTEADIDTIISLGTTLTVTNGNFTGVDRNDATYTYSEVSPTDDIIYFVLDYRNIFAAPVANDNSIDVYEDDFVDINVLENDEYVGTPIITITSNPSNGLAKVLSNNVIRYGTFGYTGTDSLTYQLATVQGDTVDTADVNIDVLTDDGGGTGATGRAFLTSTAGASGASKLDGSGACSLATPTTRYHNGTDVYPQIDDLIYTDVNKTTLFDGDNDFFKVDNYVTIKISPTGRVLSIWNCRP